MSSFCKTYIKSIQDLSVWHSDCTFSRFNCICKITSPEYKTFCVQFFSRRGGDASGKNCVNEQWLWFYAKLLIFVLMNLPSNFKVDTKYTKISSVATSSLARLVPNFKNGDFTCFTEINWILIIHSVWNFLIILTCCSSR